jgi:hypothetical protein
MLLIWKLSFQSNKDERFVLASVTMNIVYLGFEQGQQMISYIVYSFVLRMPRELFPPGVKQYVVDLTTHLHLVATSRKVDLYSHSPICPHDMRN